MQSPQSYTFSTLTFQSSHSCQCHTLKNRQNQKCTSDHLSVQGLSVSTSALKVQSSKKGWIFPQPLIMIMVKDIFLLDTCLAWGEIAFRAYWKLTSLDSKLSRMMKTASNFVMFQVFQLLKSSVLCCTLRGKLTLAGKVLHSCLIQLSKGRMVDTDLVFFKLGNVNDKCGNHLAGSKE